MQKNLHCKLHFKFLSPLPCVGLALQYGITLNKFYGRLSCFGNRFESPSLDIHTQFFVFAKLAITITNVVAEI